MPSELWIKFSGLCLFATRDDGTVTVLLPDARNLGVGGSEPRHEDRTPAAFHAGYIRMDLASLGVKATTNAPESVPHVEVVHRLHQQTISLVSKTPLSGAVDVSQLLVPNFNVAGVHDSIADGIAEDLTVRPAVLEARPDSGLLAQLTLRGGAFAPAVPTERWEFGATLRTRRTLYSGHFAGVHTWMTAVDDDFKLELTPFGKVDPTECFVLSPSDEARRVIAISIANLCATNPLEWTEYEKPSVQQDVDFKWFYKLLELPQGRTWDSELCGGELPIPLVPRTTRPDGIAGCSKARIHVPGSNGPQQLGSPEATA